MNIAATASDGERFVAINQGRLVGEAIGGVRAHIQQQRVGQAGAIGSKIVDYCAQGRRTVIALPMQCENGRATEIITSRPNRDAFDSEKIRDRDHDPRIPATVNFT